MNEKYLHELNKIDDTNVIRRLKVTKNKNGCRIAIESIGSTRRYSSMELTKEEFKQLIMKGIETL